MTNSNPLRDPRGWRLPRIAGPCVLVIFGVTGDLSRKKLMPTVYDLANHGLLPPGFSLIGFTRRDWVDQDFAGVVHDTVKESAHTRFREGVWEQLLEDIRSVPGMFDSDETFQWFRTTLEELGQARGTSGNHAFYLSIPSSYFEQVISQLKRNAITGDGENTWNRVAAKKPFGHSLRSTRELSNIVSQLFPPPEAFRIDHYLGRETMQDMLAIRFTNELFEPFWNHNYVSHVEVATARDISIGGRAGYYDGIGTTRDVIQSRLLQLLTLIAMEEPASFEASQLHTERTEVLAATQVPSNYAVHTARSQYTTGWQGGQLVRGYPEEDSVSPGSRTETYAAIRVDIDSHRRAGVPFYLRTTKHVPRRVTKVALVLKQAPHLPLPVAETAALGQNALVVRVQPDEGVTLRSGTKVPGTRMKIRDISIDSVYGGSFTGTSPEAYERLILDVLLGDPPLFPQREEMELGWKILGPVLECQDSLPTQPDPYAAGIWSPASTTEILTRDGNTWRKPWRRRP